MWLVLASINSRLLDFKRRRCQFLVWFTVSGNKKSRSGKVERQRFTWCFRSSKSAAGEDTANW